MHTGDAKRATDLYTQALSLYQSLGDEASVAAVSERVGDAAHAVGEFELARASLEESLAIAERIDDSDEHDTKISALRLQPLETLSATARRPTRVDELRPPAPPALWATRAPKSTS
jgi:predicted TPR repeat methyltransferase